MMVSVVSDHVLAHSAAWGSYSRRIGGSSIKYSHAKLHYIQRCTYHTQTPKLLNRFGRNIERKADDLIH